MNFLSVFDRFVGFARKGLIGWRVACYKQRYVCQKLSYPPGGLTNSCFESTEMFFEKIAGSQTYWYLPECQIFI